MRRSLRSATWLTCALVVTAVGAVPSSAIGAERAAGEAIPIPEVSAPIAVTASSHPFNSAATSRTPRDLAAVGYVEEEYLVGGSANVYDWLPDGSLSSVAAGPYETRILVRRPVRAARASGNVVVEMLNPTSLHDFDIVWAASQDHFIRSGDVWVGVTVKPSSITALQRFDPTRYSTLSMANPVAPRCTTTTWSGATPATENGLVWDMVTQLGALLKQRDETNPLAELRIRRTFLTGYSQTAGYVTTYINAIAPHAILDDGRPVFDGFMPIAGANFPVPINQCAPGPTRGSDRWVIQPPGALPVIAIQTLSEFYALGGFFSRRPDATGPDGNYRLYEVAGSAHVWDTHVAGAPGPSDLVQSGFPASWWDPYCERDVSTFPLEYAINGAFANISRWVDRGEPAPSAARIEVTDPGSPSATPITDADGNVVGGLRLPSIDVPRATYYGTTPGTGTCQILWGHETPFAADRLAELYPRRSSYVRQVTSRTRELLRQGWITGRDARTIIGDAAQT